MHVKLTLYAKSYANWILHYGEANIKLPSAISLLFMKMCAVSAHKILILFKLMNVNMSKFDINYYSKIHLHHV